MKKLFLSLILLSSIFSLFAQINYIDLEGIFKGKYSYDNIKNLCWRPETNQYAQIEDNALLLTDAKTGKGQTLLAKYQLAKLLDEELSRFPSFTWIGKDKLYFPAYDKVLDLTTNAVSKIDMEDVFDYQLENFLFMTKKDGYVYVQSILNDYKPILLCPDTGKNIVFGESVHRSEWGINEGQYFSPKGNYICFYRMDESMVEDYPLVNTSTPIATVETMKYPMAGRTSHDVKAGIFDVKASVAKGKAVYHYIKPTRPMVNF